MSVGRLLALPMGSVPLGAGMNLGLQLGGLDLLLAGFFFVDHVPRRTRPAEVKSRRAIALRRRLMTAAVALARVGSLAWMLPSLIADWYYGGLGLAWGSGGWESYFVLNG
jgi:hypothetical protein